MGAAGLPACRAAARLARRAQRPASFSQRAMTGCSALSRWCGEQKYLNLRCCLSSDPLLERGNQAGLADARLAGDEHHLPVALLCLPPAAQQQIELVLAADQRREGGACASPRSGSSTAASPSTCQASHRARQALQLERDRVRGSRTGRRCVAVFRRRSRAARLGERLQPRSEVWRLTDHRLLLCGAGA